MSIASNVLGTAAVVTLLVAAAAAPVSASDCAIHGTCCFVTRPAPTPWKPSAIEVVFDHLTISEGGLDRLAVRRELGRQAAPIEACFDVDGAVGVAVELVIGAAGHVNRAAATAPTHPKLATCVARALTHVKFPATRDLALTAVSLRILPSDRRRR